MTQEQQIAELTEAVGRLTSMVQLLLDDRGVLDAVPVVRRDSVRRAEAEARFQAGQARRARRQKKN